MQRLEVSDAVRHIYASLGFKGLKWKMSLIACTDIDGLMLTLYYLVLCKYTLAQRRNRLTTHFSERIPVVTRRISVQ